jgi:hypothetical protein
MKTKYCWSTIKLEFFLSEHTEFKGYFQHKYDTYTAHVRRKTAGWSLEKREWKEDCVRIALNELQIEEKDLNKAALHSITQSIRSRDFDSLNLSELERCWKILMTMVGKPTSITASPTRSNTNLEERSGNPDNLTQEEREAIERATRHLTQRSPC